jgi:hypothetical protein
MTNVTRKTIIYALKDPRDGAIRYIGRTVCPFERMTMHLKADGKTPKDRWIQELTRLHLQPKMIVIDVLKGAGDQAEREWILKLEGDHQLLNVNLPGRRRRKPEVVADEPLDGAISQYRTDREVLEMIYPDGQLSALQAAFATNAVEEHHRAPAVVVSDAAGTGWEHFWGEK